jgi:hypothetical protein
MFEISIPIPQKTQLVCILKPSTSTHTKHVIIWVKYGVTNVLECGTYINYYVLLVNTFKHEMFLNNF